MKFSNVKLENIIYFILLLFFGMFILFHFLNTSKENFDTNDEDDDETYDEAYDLNNENNVSVIKRTAIFDRNNLN
jgi:putative Mn2+ efflux pump MntP